MRMAFFIVEFTLNIKSNPFWLPVYHTTGPNLWFYLRKVEYNLLSAIQIWKQTNKQTIFHIHDYSPATESRVQVPFCSSSVGSFSKSIRHSYEPWSSRCRPSSLRAVIRTRDTRPAETECSVKRWEGYKTSKSVRDADFTCHLSGLSSV